jgi:hypothetical protein
MKYVQLSLTTAIRPPLCRCLFSYFSSRTQGKSTFGPSSHQQTQNSQNGNNLAKSRSFTTPDIFATEKPYILSEWTGPGSFEHDPGLHWMVPEKVVSKPLPSGHPETDSTPAYSSKTTFNSPPAPEVADGILSALRQNEEVEVPGEFTTIQLRSLGFEL